MRVHILYSSRKQYYAIAQNMFVTSLSTMPIKVILFSKHLEVPPSSLFSLWFKRLWCIMYVYMWYVILFLKHLEVPPSSLFSLWFRGLWCICMFTCGVCMRACVDPLISQCSCTATTFSVIFCNLLKITFMHEHVPS